MTITDIRIRKLYNETRLKALVSVTIDGDLAVHDIKVIEGPERLFVAMPSRRDETGTFRDIAHPITSAARKTLEDAILTHYAAYIAAQGTTGGGSDEISSSGGGEMPAEDGREMFPAET